MPTVTECLEAHFGGPVQVEQQSGRSGGSISFASVLSLSNGISVFAKSSRLAHAAAMFAEESEGLAALCTPGGPRVPAPIGIADEDGRVTLLMEYIPQGTFTNRWAERFGRTLATLHRNVRDPMPGYPGDNFIGATVQKNSRKDCWTTFFTEHRIGYQTELAARGGLLSSREISELERLMTRIPGMIVEPDGDPSLVHGDLWTGNALAGPEDEPVIIDPAVHFAHREVDLAMSELFGRFPEAFYRSYEETWPLEPGYSQRRDLYNLYHLLNHLNLFGAGYHGGVMATVKQYI